MAGKNAVLTDEEAKVFKKNLKRIEGIVDDIFEEGVPADNRDKRMALEAINSLNDGILKHAEIRKKAEEGEGDDAVKAGIIALATEIRKIKSKPSKQQIVDIDESEVDEILPTSLSQEREELLIESFIGVEDDDDK